MGPDQDQVRRVLKKVRQAIVCTAATTSNVPLMLINTPAPLHLILIRTFLCSNFFRDQILSSSNWITGETPWLRLQEPVSLQRWQYKASSRIYFPLSPRAIL